MRPPADPSCLRASGPWVHRKVSANGIQLHLAENGPSDSTDLVVLLHGFPQFWWTWRHQLQSLAGLNRRVVALDLRGFGGSDKQPNDNDLLTLARDVAGAIGALGAQRSVIIGQGLGGTVAWTMPFVARSRVNAIVALGTAHPLGVRTLYSRLFTGMALEYLGLQVPYFPERALRSGALIRRIFNSWAGPEQREVLLEQAPRYTQAMRLPRAANASLRHLRQTRRLPLSVKNGLNWPVPVPVLTIHGQVDPVMPAQAQARDARYVQSAITQISLPGVGHFPSEEAPEAVSEILDEFLTAQGFAG